MNFRNKRFYRKLLEFIDSLSIQTQLVAAYIAVILLPTAIFSAFILDDFYENALADKININQSMLDSEMKAIQTHIEIMERTVQMSISDRDVLDYLVDRQDKSIQELMSFQTGPLSQLQMLLFSNPNIANIHLYTNNPYISELWPFIFSEERIKDRHWYGKVLNERGTVRWEFLNNERELLKRIPSDKESIRDYVSVFYVIDYPKETYAGIIKIDMPLDIFFAKAYSNIEGVQSQMLVVDRDNKIYTNESTSFYSQINQDIIIEKYNKNLSSANNYFTLELEGTPYIVLYSHIDRLDANLLHIVSLEDMASEVNQTRFNILAVTIVLITILSILTYFLQSFILKKLKVLRDSIKKVRNGNLDVAIDIRGNSEVSELAYHFQEMVGKINYLIAEAVNKQAITKEAELNALKNQIDAHFLYNTLENIKMLAEIKGEYTISDSLTSLGGMMRYSLQWTSERVLLQEEALHIQNYIAIMKIRYDNQIELVIDISNEYLNCEVLKMLLQPVVENSVKHGFGKVHRKQTKLIIEVNASVNSGFMYIVIVDNGIGITALQLDELNAKLKMTDIDFMELNGNTNTNSSDGGIGLRNVYQRMVIHNNTDDPLIIESVEQQYTKVTLKLPLREAIGGGNRETLTTSR